jgi:predicted DNA-binding WGR domain protein
LIPAACLGLLLCNESTFSEPQFNPAMVVFMDNPLYDGNDEVSTHEKWQPEIQYFHDVYNSGKRNHKTEHMIMAMFNKFVDSGSFEEGYRPDWLLGVDDLSENGPKVPLELDGYNHVEGQKDICVEYNGPVHYVPPEDRNARAKWLRGRRNDDIKRKHFKSDSSKHFIIMHYMLPNVYIEGKDVMSNFGKIGRRINIEDQIQVYLKYVLSRLAELKRLKDYFGDGFGGTTPTKYLSSMGMYVNACAEPPISGELRKEFKNLVVSYATPLTMNRGQYNNMLQQNKIANKKAAARAERERLIAEKNKRRAEAQAQRTPVMY